MSKQERKLWVDELDEKTITWGQTIQVLAIFAVLGIGLAGVIRLIQGVI
jgi:hypothetical protein